MDVEFLETVLRRNNLMLQQILGKDYVELTLEDLAFARQQSVEKYLLNPAGMVLYDMMQEMKKRGL